MPRASRSPAPLPPAGPELWPAQADGPLARRAWRGRDGSPVTRSLQTTAGSHLQPSLSPQTSTKVPSRREGTGPSLGRPPGRRALLRSGRALCLREPGPRQHSPCLPLADSFLVLMILAAYSWPASTFTHLRTTEKAPLKGQRRWRGEEGPKGRHLTRTDPSPCVYSMRAGETSCGAAGAHGDSRGLTRGQGRAGDPGEPLVADSQGLGLMR